jgi:hypothetical protein
MANLYYKYLFKHKRTVRFSSACRYFNTNTLRRLVGILNHMLEHHFRIFRQSDSMSEYHNPYTFVDYREDHIYHPWKPGYQGSLMELAKHWHRTELSSLKDPKKWR